MAFFNLNEYQTVEERISLFWEKYPNGRILNEIVFDDGERVVIRSEVYTDKDDMRPTAVDYAEEVKATKGVNQTSRIENGCTSATGRALSLLGGDFSPKGKRPSRQEMEKVQRMTSDSPPKKQESAPRKQEVRVVQMDSRRQAISDRLNALPDGIRVSAKQTFLECFGRPSHIESKMLDEAEEMVTMFETGELQS